MELPDELRAPGLRERKKLRTRQTIERAALELVLDRGYEKATITAIALRADVAPRTLHTSFAGGKDEILLGDPEAGLTELRAALADGPGTTVDRLERWIATERPEEESEISGLRMRASLADPHMRALERPRLEVLERAIAEAAALELGLEADALDVRTFAGAAVRMLLGLRLRAVEDPAHVARDLTLGLRVLRAAHVGLASAFA